MESKIHLVNNLRTNEGFTLSREGKFARTKYLGTLLKFRTNEKRTNQNRTNQGPGVLCLISKNILLQCVKGVGVFKK